MFEIKIKVFEHNTKNMKFACTIQAWTFYIFIFEYFRNSKTTPLLVSTIIMSVLVVILTTILFCVCLKSRNKGKYQC
jgi:putative effector of murein hydrolase